MKKKYVNVKVEILSFNSDVIKMSGTPLYKFFDNIASDLFNL